MPVSTRLPKKPSIVPVTAISNTPIVDPPKSHPLVAEKVGQNDIMSITHYVKVRNIDLKQGKGFNGRDLLSVTGLDKGVTDFEVYGRTLIENMTSADFFAEEREVSQTECAEHLVHAGKDPFKVEFTKKDGTLRTLRGRFLSEDRYFGRSNVIDLDIERDDSKSNYDNRIRQVTHLDIHSIIVRGIKYLSKTKK